MSMCTSSIMIDLEAAEHRLVDRLVEQLRDLVDAAVRGRVELDVVDEAAGVDVAAGLRTRRTACAVMPPCPSGPGAVERLGEDARDRRLADAARAGEQVGVVQALLRRARWRAPARRAPAPPAPRNCAAGTCARARRGRHANDSTGRPLAAPAPLRDNPRHRGRPMPHRLRPTAAPLSYEQARASTTT